jgi:predicted PurR-regulated permease PerM
MLFFAALALVVVAMIYPYLGVLFFSLIMVFILKPFYDRMLGWMGGRSGLAVSLTLLITIIAPLVVLGGSVALVYRQLAGLATSIPTTASPQQAADGLNRLVESLASAGFSSSFSKADLVKALSGLAGVLISASLSLGFSLFSLLLNLLIFVTVVAPLLVHYDAAIDWVQQYSPFPEQVSQLFIQRIRSMTLAMFVSIFVIALAQCLVMGVFFWLAGVQPLTLWIFLSFLAATMPFGISIIAIPLGIYLIATGSIPAGWTLILGYLVVVSNIDTILRPKLIPKGASLVYVLALLSCLGGLSLFGYLGVIYGPVIMVTFVTAMEVYWSTYAGAKDAGNAAQG